MGRIIAGIILIALQLMSTVGSMKEASMQIARTGYSLVKVSYFGPVGIAGVILLISGIIAVSVKSSAKRAKYDALWETMKKKGLSPYDLTQRGISSSTLEALRKNKEIGPEVMEKLCAILDCTEEGILGPKTISAASYEPLWETMKKKGISPYELSHKGISSNTLEDLRKNKEISLEVMEKLCAILECTPEEIVKYTITAK